MKATQKWQRDVSEKLHSLNLFFSISTSPLCQALTGWNVLDLDIRECIWVNTPTKHCKMSYSICSGSFMPQVQIPNKINFVCRPPVVGKIKSQSKNKYWQNYWNIKQSDAQYLFGLLADQHCLYSMDQRDSLSGLKYIFFYL